MIAASFLPAIGADGFADFGEEEPQEIGDFSGRADGGAGRADGILLFDGNRRADVDQAVDVGAIHLVEKHPRIGRERLHVPPLSFGEEGIEGEGGFT